SPPELYVTAGAEFSPGACETPCRGVVALNPGVVRCPRCNLCATRGKVMGVRGCAVWVGGTRSGWLVRRTTSDCAHAIVFRRMMNIQANRSGFMTYPFRFSFCGGSGLAS